MADSTVPASFLPPTRRFFAGVVSALLLGCGGGGGGGGGGGPNTPPTAAINAPVTGAVAIRGDTVAVRFTANDDGAADVRLIASVDANALTVGDNTVVFGPEADANGTPVTRNAATAALPVGVYFLFLTVDDGVNAVAIANLAGPFVVVAGHAGVAPPRSTAFGVRGNRVLMSVGEAEDGGTVLNGDADTGDGVLATLDALTGAFTQHALSTDVTAAPGGVARVLENDGAFLLFPVREADQGFINADLDQADTMLGWWKPLTPALDLHVYGGVFATGRVFATKAVVTVVEFQEGPGGTTLNGDADAADTVAGTIDMAPAGGAQYVVGLASTLPPNVQVDNGFAAVQVSEPNGGADLNGDLDALDDLVLATNLATNAPVGFAGVIVPPGGARTALPGSAFDVSANSRVVYYANEAAPGVDLNGDGDAFDDVPSVWNPAVGPPFVEAFPGVPALSLQAGNPRIAVYQGSRSLYTSMEARTAGPADDNGDGDQADQEVLRWTDDATVGVSTVLAPNLLGFPLTGLALDGGFVAEVAPNVLSVVVQEGANGALDLSGDGNIGFALLLVDTSTAVPTVTNTGLSPMAGPVPGAIPMTGVKGPNGIAVLVSETVNGDLNGDADATDTLLFYVPFAAPAAPVNLGDSAASDVRLAGSTIGVIANEATNGTDYDGDSDTNDVVFRAFDTAGVVLASGLLAAPSSRVASDDGSLWAFLRSEGVESRDLNGDGDQLDVVVGCWKP